jgi:ABC-type multidrug transport system fused ATPase/permease subunit
LNLKDRKIWFSLVAFIFVVIAFTQAIDGIGARRTEDSLVRALATYGLARALNGVISVAQGTEIAIEPVGVGVTLTPGQILDPVNDLVERFSWVMLVSSASLGVLNVLLTMSVWFWLSICLVIVLAIATYFQWRPSQADSRVQVVITRLAMLLIILRFVAPVIAIANDVIYQQFLAPRYQTALMELEHTTEKITHINEEIGKEVTADSESSLLNKARELYDAAAKSVSQTIDVESRMSRYEEAVSNASRHVIDMIVIFIFQTIILPIVFLWIAWHLSKWILLSHLPVGYIVNQPAN